MYIHIHCKARIDNEYLRTCVLQPLIKCCASHFSVGGNTVSSVYGFLYLGEKKKKRKDTSISKDYIYPVIQVKGAKIDQQFSSAWRMEVENMKWRVREVQKEQARQIPLDQHQLIAAVWKLYKKKTRSSKGKKEEKTLDFILPLATFYNPPLYEQRRPYFFMLFLLLSQFFFTHPGNFPSSIEWRGGRVAPL